MTIPLDLLLHFALGAVVGTYAARAIGREGALINRFLVALIGSTVVLFVPLAVIRFKFWNDWSWVYLLDPLDHPAKAKLPAEAAALSLLLLASIVGYRVAFRAASTLARAAAIAAPVVVLTACAVVLSARVFHVGTFDEFIHARAPSPIENPWIVAMFAAEIAAMIGTVAIQRRLLIGLARSGRIGPSLVRGVLS